MSQARLGTAPSHYARLVSILRFSDQMKVSTSNFLNFHEYLGGLAGRLNWLSQVSYEILFRKGSDENKNSWFSKKKLGVVAMQIEAVWNVAKSYPIENKICNTSPRGVLHKNPLPLTRRGLNPSTERCKLIISRSKISYLTFYRTSLCKREWTVLLPAALLAHHILYCSVIKLHSNGESIFF